MSRRRCPGQGAHDLAQRGCRSKRGLVAVGTKVMGTHGEHQPFRVLYVDDNRDLADSTVWLLQIRGFLALACYDGQTALKVANEFRPSLCMVDLHMPGMDGDELAIRLRAQLPQPLLLVAVTAMS